MYPLKVIYIGRSNESFKEVQKELFRLNIQIVANFADLQAARTGLVEISRTQRQLFLIQFTSQEDLATIEHFANAFEGWPILVLIPDRFPESVLLQVNRAGASQTVTAPYEFEAFQKALVRIARQCGFEITPTQLIAVVGAMEGAGATSLAVNFCAELVRQYDTSVLLIEMARQVGMVSSYLNLEPTYRTKHLFGEPDRIDLTLVKQTMVAVNGQDKWKVIAAPCHLLPPLNIRPKDALRLVSYARELAQFIVIDWPFLFDDTFFQVSNLADHILLVGQPILPSLRIMRAIQQHFKDSTFKGKLHPIINRYNSKTTAFSVERLKEALGVQSLHILSDEPFLFTQAVNLGVPLHEVAGQAHTLQEIRGITQSVVQSDLPTAKKPSSMMGKLTKFLQKV
jgi:Flp pilus assembly CpaE family ATPase